MNPVEVAAAVITDRHGRVLISRRAAHQHQGGLWEFPGGKLEPGESPQQALARELEEELGIRPVATEPLIRIPWRYPDKSVLLHVMRVTAWQGTPHGREGQPLRWLGAGDLAAREFPAANHPIIAALRLPPLVAITGPFADEDELCHRAERAFSRGAGMLILRAPDRSAQELATLAAAIRPLCKAAGALLVVNADPRRLDPVLADGIHLNRHLLAELRQEDLAPWRARWIGASCHDPGELARADALGADYCLLSPVRPTSSHPGSEPLGLERFAAWVADQPRPVYGLGGLGPADLAQMRAAGGQGIAAIGAFWAD